MTSRQLTDEDALITPAAATSKRFHVIAQRQAALPCPVDRGGQANFSADYQ